MFKKTFVFKGCALVKDYYRDTYKVVCDCGNNPVETSAVSLAQAKSYICYKIRRERLHTVYNLPLVLKGEIEEVR